MNHFTVPHQLQPAGKEKYDFDFGTPGTGVRTAAPNWRVPQDGLDLFGKILTEISDNNPLATTYDPMGQVISHGERQLEWDPWGRLLKVVDPSFTWEASYDALGRRLQTRHTSGWSSTLTTTSLYDPEEEFQEIGVKYGNKTFWKIYGPNTCDAITDETGDSVVLLHNALGQLTALVSRQGTIYTDQFPSSYGPQSATPSLPSDLLSYAQSLSWHSRPQDPTALIWMGSRYYDPKSGRFLSPDPIGYPICLDLYAYAGGDPINYIDPDGRFASPVYQATKSTIITAFQPNGFNLAMQGCNILSAYCGNNGLTRSGSFQVGSLDLAKGAIGFINGISNQQGQSIQSARRLSQYAQGTKIYGIYNATHSMGVDILECAMGHMGFHMPSVQLLKNQWDHFIATHRPEEKCLQFSHSGGSLQVYNALLTSPESVRQRIISAAFAPAVIIPRKLCFQADNYVSRRDFVTHLDIMGKLKYGNQLHVLEPHPDANFWDHEFLSPTFEASIKLHITDYINNGGNK
jgi:RHS repeat-associated protein